MSAVKSNLNFNVGRLNFQDMQAEMYSLNTQSGSFEASEKLFKMAYLL